MLKVILSLVVIVGVLFGDDTQTTAVKELRREVVPLSRTLFQVIDLKTGIEHIVDLTGKDFIVVSVRERGSDGRFYAVDKDGTVWWSL